MLPVEQRLFDVSNKTHTEENSEPTDSRSEHAADALKGKHVPGGAGAQPACDGWSAAKPANGINKVTTGRNHQHVVSGAWASTARWLFLSNVETHQHVFSLISV